MKEVILTGRVAVGLDHGPCTPRGRDIQGISVWVDVGAGRAVRGVLVDREEPSIKPLVINDQQLSFHISDELSGIKSYNGYINDQWVLFEYDPKNDRLTYHIDTERLKQAKSYELELYVSDPLNNIATYHDTLTINRSQKEKR